MKTGIYLLVLFTLSTSCGKKTNVQGGISSPQVDHFEERNTPDVYKGDSDFDGVSDDEEVKLGRNPYISNIPRTLSRTLGPISLIWKFNSKERGELEFFEEVYKKPVKRSSTGQESFLNQFSDFRVKNSFIEKKISRLLFKKLSEDQIERQDFPSFEDGDTETFSCLDEKQYFLLNQSLNSIRKKYHFISSVLKSNFSDLEEDTQLFYGDNQYFFKKINKLDQESNFEIISKNYFQANLGEYAKCFYLRSSRFTAKNDFKNKSIEKGRIKKSQSHVFISLLGETVMLSVSPRRFKNVVEILSDSKIQFELTSKGQLFSAFGIENDGMNVFKESHAGERKLGMGQWEFFSASGDDIKQELKASEVYVLAYRSINEVLGASTFTQTLVDNENILNNSLTNSKGIQIADSQFGDTIEIRAELSSEIAFLKGSSISDYFIDGYRNEKFCAQRESHCSACKCLRRETMKKRVKNVCKVQRRFKNLGILGRKKEFINGRDEVDYALIIPASGRLIKPFLKSDLTLVYKFQVGRKDLDPDGKSISLNLKNYGETKKVNYDVIDLYTPKNGHHCYQGDRKELSSSVELGRRIFLSGILKRSGIKR